MATDRKAPSSRPASRRASSTPRDDPLRKVEIALLRRQNHASYANVISTFVLSAALLTLTYCQWQTAESTAAIERAKARPHFRISQTNLHDELGFLPREFRIQGEGGVSDAAEAQATSVMEVRYVSRDLAVFGACRVSFVNFYSWTNDAMSFEMNQAAAKLMELSRRPDRVSPSFIRLRPLWVVVGISFTDIYGENLRQNLLLYAGQSTRLTPAALAERTRADLTLNLLLEPSGRVAVYRIAPTPLTPDCRNALRVMARIPWLRLAGPGEQPQDTDQPF
ncbi:MAG: hypothetical protein QOH32_4398, partial [Bradyrhizobium sp.]|nr:hypothetical protein [Bradyrhizobium sp.]